MIIAPISVAMEDIVMRSSRSRSSAAGPYISIE